MIESCEHGDAVFTVAIEEEGSLRLLCFSCVLEEIQELPPGWAARVTRQED